LQYKRPKRPISGVLLLDKPAGYSSNQALQRAKHMYMAAKAGHTGNLDPFATGLLPLCFGEATKFSQTLLDADKVYRAVLKLGVTTTTGDTEGEVTSQMQVDFTNEQVERAVLSFTGPIAQVPPMYSALKHQGKPLYEYARNGVEIERKARDVNIHEIRLLSFVGDEAEIYVSCSKGTYIRVLAEDIGKQLGCGAHLIVLQRLNTGGFSLADAYTLAQLEAMDASARDALLLPVDALLQWLPMVELDADAAHYFRQGQAIWKSGIQQPGLIRVYAPQNTFLGLAENVGDGRIAPRRVLATEP
jgi:tRNA pseudouridine55 synthase